MTRNQRTGALTEAGRARLTQEIEKIQAKNPSLKGTRGQSLQTFIEQKLKGTGQKPGRSPVSASTINKILEGTPPVTLSSVSNLIESLEIKKFPLDEYWEWMEDLSQNKDDGIDPENVTVEAEDFIPHNIPLSGAMRFVGRGLELGMLDNILRDSSNASSFVALSGMSGVGKTELSIRYAFHHLATYPGGVCWINARKEDAHNNEDIVTQIKSFFQGKLNIAIPSHLKTDAECLDFCFTSWRTGNALLIFDDVQSFRDISFALSRLRSSRFKVIATTRLRNLGNTFTTIKIDEFSLQESLEMLSSTAGAECIERASESADQLCIFLGHLPLALELVGKYIALDPTITIEQVLTELRNRQGSETILDHESLQGSEEDPMWDLTAKRGLSAAFDLTWERLDESAKEVALFIGRCAFCPIPWSLIEIMKKNKEQEWFQNESLELELLRASRNKLMAHSLLKIRGGNSFTYLIHTLTRLYFRSKTDSPKDIDRLFVLAINEILLEPPHVPLSEYFSRMIPYVRHISEAANISICSLRNDELSYVLNFSQYYWSHNLMDRSTDLLESLLQKIRELSNVDPIAFTDLLLTLALRYHEQNNYARAMSLIYGAIDIRKNAVHSLFENQADLSILLPANHHYLSTWQLLAKNMIYQEQFELAQDTLNKIGSATHEISDLFLAMNNSPQMLLELIRYFYVIKIRTQYLRGFMFHKAAMYHEAQEFLSGAVNGYKQGLIQNRDPEYINFLTTLGFNYLRLGINHEAERCAQEALEFLNEICEFYDFPLTEHPTYELHIFGELSLLLVQSCQGFDRFKKHEKLLNAVVDHTTRMTPETIAEMKRYWSESM
jgi:tetratricopeptide (TPR) repeat protein